MRAGDAILFEFYAAGPMHGVYEAREVVLLFFVFTFVFAVSQILRLLVGTESNEPVFDTANCHSSWLAVQLAYLLQRRRSSRGHVCGREK